MSIGAATLNHHQSPVALAQTGNGLSTAAVSAENRGSVLKPVVEAQSLNRPNSATQSQGAPIHQAETRQASFQQEPQQESQQAPQEGSASAQASAQEKQQELLERQHIQALSARDREVRNHERAHAAVGGAYAGAPRYEYQRGPDGVNYAIAGEVPISTGAISGDPQATIDKAQVIRRAALAPAEPSPQDRQVAAQASQMEAQARLELAELQRLAQESPRAEPATEVDVQADDGLEAEGQEEDGSNRLHPQSTSLHQRLIHDNAETRAGQIVSDFA